MAAPKASGSTTQQALIKEDQRNEDLEMKITSKWSNIGDTNLKNFNVKKFREAPYIGKPSPIAKKIIDSGIIKAVGFPPVVRCHELMIECAKHYDSHSRTIVAKDGIALAYLSEGAIGEAFHLTKQRDMIYKSLEGTKSIYKNDPDACLTFINRNWLLKSRPRLNKVPNVPHGVDFQEEFKDLITMLN